MEHNLFNPKTLEEAKHAVVGDCNGFTMQQRWDVETPLFAKEIISLLKPQIVNNILDYGCGTGRLAKEILVQGGPNNILGVDASLDMMKQAREYVNSEYFQTSNPQNIGLRFDLAYCVYVLQHVPAIEIREILQRIHYHLKDEGVFVYCSSDYRMAIRFDGQGFFDDRFLGVDLQAEVERYFEKVKPLFSDQYLATHSFIRKMVKGDANGLAHPAFIYKKRNLSTRLFDAIPNEHNAKVVLTGPIKKGKPTLSPVEIFEEITKKEYTKLILMNRLAPGDILVMTNALRDLHLAYPGKYETEVRSPCNEIFENNPYFTKLSYDENKYNEINNRYCSRSHEENDKLFGKLRAGDKSVIKELTIPISDDILTIDMHYPLIHNSGAAGWHFGYGHRDWLETVLEVKIPQTSVTPEIYLSQAETDWINPVLVATGDDSPYWVINAGSKGDYTLKQYPYYQEVVDLLRDKVKFVQIGQKGHNHVPLTGVIDMVGRTDVRKLFRVIKGALGCLTCVSFPMHIAAAFNKPCVVVAGGREGTRWELYPNHQFLYVNGCLPCAPYDGCWKSKFEECLSPVGNVPKCMTMITPQDIARSIERYYQGGMLTY